MRRLATGSLLIVVFGLAALHFTGDTESPSVGPVENRAAIEVGPPKVAKPVDAPQRVSLPIWSGDTLSVRIECMVSPGVIKAVPGLHLDVGVDLIDDVGQTHLATGMTDAHGEAVVSLPLSSIDDSEAPQDLWVWATLREAGYERRVRAVSLKGLDRTSGDPISVAVIARPGATLNGVVLSRDGRSIQGTVKGYQRDHMGRWVRRLTAYANAETGFAIDLREGGCGSSRRTEFRRGTTSNTIQVPPAQVSSTSP